MSVLILIYAAIFGAVIGSFLNVVVFRMEKGKSLGGRSHCPHCKKQLTPTELVPIFSYLFQKGRCRNCKTGLSPQYPLVEAGMSILAVLVVQYGLQHALSVAQMGTLGILVALLLLIVVYDFRHTIIPNTFVYSFAYFAVVYSVLPCANSSDILTCFESSSFLAGPLLFLPLFLLWDLSDGMAIGLGDAKLALGMGWLLGIEHGFSALLLGFWIGAFVGVLLISSPYITRIVGPLFSLWHSNKEKTLSFGMKSELPFAPFLVLATLIVLFTDFNIFHFFW